MTWFLPRHDAGSAHPTPGAMTGSEALLSKVLKAVRTPSSMASCDDNCKHLVEGTEGGALTFHIREKRVLAAEEPLEVA